ncbi:NAD kinase [Eupransor demetentiae]|uniref:NAD kinase n=1 Tax=Eupransor demetentiae TaxID=3109584 RepID=A0ABP0EPF2_9LACO|nr:NAD kinase (NadK) [Lactobacillaceae bacterium LMG 33000]
MKVAIYHNETDLTKQIVSELQAELKKNNIQQDDENPEVVISVGGDGTLLGAFHHYIEYDDVRFVGLHTGHLGFYTDWLRNEVPELVAGLLKDDGQRVAYPLLKMTMVKSNGDKEEYLALNEATIKQFAGTLVADIYLGDRLFEGFRGDGVSVATPTGSTAYSKANGGAVVHPSIPSIQMSEIASINNRVFRTLGSPLIVPAGQVITVKPRENEFLVTCDQMVLHAKDVQKVHFQVAAKKVYFASYRHVDFWKRVQNAFISDED